MVGKFLANIGKNAILAVGILLIAVVGFIDYITTVEISFSIFYLIPIALVSWYAGKNYGLAFAILSAAVWLYADTNSYFQYSNSAIPYWNALVRLGFFTVVVILISKVHLLKLNLEENVNSRTSDLLMEINEHKKAKEELQKKTVLLSELTRKIETIKEEENTKIAREIHDELGQALTAINLEIMWIGKKYSNNSDIVERALLVSKIVNETIKSVRKISTRLRPRLIDEIGLFPAIESQMLEFQLRTGIRCCLNLPAENIEFSPAVSSSLFRIFQEAMTNIARHAKASDIQIDISKNGDDILKMRIKDNGVGLKEQNNNNGHVKSLGILGMKERAIILGGNLDIKSIPDKGTEIVLNIPLNNHYAGLND